MNPFLPFFLSAAVLLCAVGDGHALLAVPANQTVFFERNVISDDWYGDYGLRLWYVARCGVTFVL